MRSARQYGCMKVAFPHTLKSLRVESCWVCMGTLAKLLVIVAAVLLSSVVIPNHASAQDEKVKEVQQFLAEQGYEPGTADGFWGPRTSQAIEEFQTAEGLPVTGQIDPATEERIDAIQNPPPPEPEIVPPQASEPSSSSNDYLWWLAGFAGLFLLWLLGRKPKKSKPNHHQDQVSEALSKPQPVTRQASSEELSLPSSSGSASTPVKARSSEAWIPSGRSANVAGFDLGSMIYVGKPPFDRSRGSKCSAYIDPSLSVSKRDLDLEGEGLPYWPNYSDITPRARGTYLHWLSEGRNGPQYNPGYLFLYFYGLERRFFVDQSSSEERKLIVEEVKRLLRIYPENYSVRSYLGRFIDVAEMLVLGPASIKPNYEIDRISFELPASILIAIGSRIALQRPIKSDWMLSWFLADPERNLRTPAMRCPEEFNALFKILFERRYPNGLKVDPPRRPLKIEYRAASMEFERKLMPKVDGTPVVDVSALRKPLSIAQDIANEAMERLDKFSRFLGKNPNQENSLQAHLLLPSELKEAFPLEDAQALSQWLNGAAVKGSLVSLEALLEQLGRGIPDKLTKKIHDEASDALAALGYGMAPDPNYSIRRLKLDDEVRVFQLSPSSNRLTEPSSQFTSALHNLALSAFIAHADGQIAASEIEAMRSLIIDAAKLSEDERVVLNANLDWFVLTEPDFGFLRRRLKEVSPQSAHVVRRLAVDIARADSIIHADEVRSLEKIYQTLGFNEAEVYSDLHAGTQEAGPVSVRAAQPDPTGEEIPPEVSSKPGLNLDHSRISTLTAETEQAKRALSEIFDDPSDVEETAPEDIEAEHSLSNAFAGLDAVHSKFAFELVQREFWSTNEFRSLAQQHGLLSAGGLETLNEWAFDKFDDALVEEYDGYEINQDIAVLIRQQV